MLQYFQEFVIQNIVHPLVMESRGNAIHLLPPASLPKAEAGPSADGPGERLAWLNGSVCLHLDISFMMVWALLLFSSHGFAQTPRPICRLLISTQKIYPGSVFLAEARCTESITSATGSFCQRRLIFFPGKKKTVSYAFAGVDLETKPEKYRLEARAELEGTGLVELQKSVRVFPKQFPIQKITVAEKYAKPNPADQKRAEEETKRLETIWKTASTSRYWDGKFTVPLVSELTSGFGRRRVVNGESRSPHSGVDLKADTGTPIRATNRGKVVVAEDLFFSGNTVVIDHGFGLYTFYGHCSKILVQVNEMVNPGQVIAEVGATGRVTGPHLHWACRLNEARVNPLDLLSLETID